MGASPARAAQRTSRYAGHQHRQPPVHQCGALDSLDRIALARVAGTVRQMELGLPSLCSLGLKGLLAKGGGGLVTVAGDGMANRGLDGDSSAPAFGW